MELEQTDATRPRIASVKHFSYNNPLTAASTSKSGYLKAQQQ